jgi:uncharacterized RDD family membrane protein YckC
MATDIELSPRAGEPAATDAEIAGVGSRMLAGLIDACLMLGLWLLAAMAPLVLVARARAAASDIARNILGREWILRGVDAVGLGTVAASLFAATVGYYVFAELVTGGRSPGKRVVGLRVVRTGGLPLGWAQSVVRNLVRIVDWLPGTYGVGLIASVANPKAQRLGDLAAGTTVVRERSRPRAWGSVGVPAVPERLGSVLGRDEATLLFSFWTRGPTIAPAVRARLASQIAPLLRSRLADASTLDDESFLWALLREGDQARP